MKIVWLLFFSIKAPIFSGYCSTKHKSAPCYLPLFLFTVFSVSDSFKKKKKLDNMEAHSFATLVPEYKQTLLAIMHYMPVSELFTCRVLTLSGITVFQTFEIVLLFFSCDGIKQDHFRFRDLSFFPLFRRTSLK